jgi:hypothetical protein
LYYINHKCPFFQATLYMMNYQLYLRSITYIMCYYYLFKESSGFWLGNIQVWNCHINSIANQIWIFTFISAKWHQRVDMKNRFFAQYEELQVLGLRLSTSSYYAQPHSIIAINILNKCTVCWFGNPASKCSRGYRKDNTEQTIYSTHFFVKPTSVNSIERLKLF